MGVLDVFSFGLWSQYKNEKQMNNEFKLYMMNRKLNYVLRISPLPPTTPVQPSDTPLNK